MLHREAEAMRLPRLVVRVLPQYHNFHFIERRAVKSSKDVFALGVANVLLPFLHEKVFELREIGRFELRAQHLQPAGFYLRVYHILVYSIEKATTACRSRLGLFLQKGVATSFYSNGGEVAMTGQHLAIVGQGE